MTNNLNKNDLQINQQLSQTVNPLNTANTALNQPLSLGSSNSSSALAASSGDGLRGEYYDNIDFTNLKLTRTDANVNFNFGSGSPDTSIGADTFSIRWTGQVEAQYNEAYTFYTTTDDGVRLFVNDQLVINRGDQSATEAASTPITLAAGQKYNIRLEYYENRGQAVSRLAWSSVSQVKQIIPQSQLFLPENIAPTATASTTGITTGGATTYDFTISYSDNAAVDISSLDSTDIRVTNSNGFNQLARFVSVTPSGNGTPRTATYRINTPGGTWDAADNGSYTVALEASQVRDINGNFAAAGNLGNFSVNIAGTGTGLQGEYYDNIDFTNLKLTRTDANVNFNFGSGSPDTSIGADTFSIRWTGQVEAQYNEAYTFYTTTDDGVKLFINDQLVINRGDQSATEAASTPITLAAGQKYNIRLEYYENRGQDSLGQA
jgi:PA14 domain